MARFDFVFLEIKCPTCGEELKDFQTKDSEYPKFKRLDFRTLRNFYDYCDNCHTWVEFTLKEGLLEGKSLDDYIMITKDYSKEIE